MYNISTTKETLACRDSLQRGEYPGSRYSFDSELITIIYKELKKKPP
jgi:hypothetical protein